MSGTLELLVPQFEQLNQKLRQERESLAKLENRTAEPCGRIHFDRTPIEKVPEAKEIRERIAALEIEVASVGAAIQAISAADDERRRKAEQLEKWKPLVAECRAARTARDKLARELEGLNNSLENARNKLDFAENNLAQHNRSLLRPGDYPSDKELEDEREHGAKLEAEIYEGRAECKEINLRRAEVQRNWFEACKRFNALADQEIRLRPQQEAAQSQR